MQTNPEQTDGLPDVQFFLDAANVVFVAVDLNGTVTLINRKGSEILGIPAEHIVGKNWFDVAVPEPYRTQARSATLLLNRASVEEGDDPVWPMITANGGTRVFSWSHTPVKDDHQRVRGILCTGEDVTDQQQAEEAAQYLAAIVESSEDAIIGKTLDGKIHSWNKGAEHMYGYSSAEIIGQSVSIIVPSDRRDEFKQFLRKVRKGISIQQEETVRLRKNGSRIDVSITLSPVIDRNQRIVGISTITRDISEKKRLEREILLISEQERQRIGRDLHDGLGSLLTGLAMRMQALSKSASRGQEVSALDLEQVAQFIETGAEQARALARGLNPVLLEREGLAAALQELTASTQTISAAQCTFQQDDPIPVLENTVATQLYWIAQEAVNNATRHARAHQILIRLHVKNGRLGLVVRDDGVGLVKSAIGSRGMGLHVMPYRAHLIGATFDVNRAPGGGTQVSCSLPLEKALRSPIPAGDLQKP